MIHTNQDNVIRLRCWWLGWSSVHLWWYKISLLWVFFHSFSRRAVFAPFFLDGDLRLAVFVCKFIHSSAWRRWAEAKETHLLLFPEGSGVINLIYWQRKSHSSDTSSAVSELALVRTSQWHSSCLFLGDLHFNAGKRIHSRSHVQNVHSGLFEGWFTHRTKSPSP